MKSCLTCIRGPVRREGLACLHCDDDLHLWAKAEYATQTLPAGPSPTDGAPEFLRRAAEIMEERGKQYDTPGGERSMARTVQAFNAITARDLTEAEGWLLLQLLKDVRQWQRPEFHQDSADDCVAYAALKAEALSRAA